MGSLILIFVLAFASYLTKVLWNKTASIVVTVLNVVIAIVLLPAMWSDPSNEAVVGFSLSIFYAFLFVAFNIVFFFGAMVFSNFFVGSGKKEVEEELTEEEKKVIEELKVEVKRIRNKHNNGKRLTKKEKEIVEICKEAGHDILEDDDDEDYEYYEESSSRSYSHDDDDDDDEEEYGKYVIQYRNGYGGWVDGPGSNDERVAERMFDNFISNEMSRRNATRARLVKVGRYGKILSVLGTS